MFQSRMPHVIFLRKSIQDQESCHAILISLLRGLAAIQVAAAHLRAQIFPSLKGLEDATAWYQALAFVTGFAHQAVVVFFLLSGWLVGGSLLNKLGEPGAMLSYAIDRVTRLWIVLIPAFVLTLAIGAVTQGVDLTAVSVDRHNEFSLTTFLGNLVGLQDMLVPRFGGNFPLWSLANETWYYVLFPVLVLPFCGRSAPVRAGAALAAALLVCYLSADIVLYFPLWLLGVVFSRIRITLSGAQRWVLAGALAVACVYFRLNGSNDKLDASSLVQDVILSIPFLVLLSSLQFKVGPAQGLLRTAGAIGQRAAAFSFTLYVVHVPFLYLLRRLYSPLSHAGLSPHNFADFGVYLVMLGLIVGLAYLFHLPFEAQTLRVRGAIKDRVARRAGGQAANVAVSAGKS